MAADRRAARDAGGTGTSRRLTQTAAGVPSGAPGSQPCRRAAAGRAADARLSPVAGAADYVSDDPSLSPAANRILTEEARQAVGADRVRVPRDTPHVERERHGDHGTIGEAFAANRILISITFFALLVVGA